MASVMSELKNFFSRIRFGKLVCVLLTLAVITCLTACDAPETNPDEKVDFEPASSGCLTCPVFDVFYSAGEALYKTTHENTAKPAIKLLGMGFAIWLAFHVMKFVGSFKEPDVAGFWNGLAVRAFWVLLIGSFLGNIDEIMELAINPIFGAFLEVSTEVISKLPASSEGAISCSASDPKSGLVCVVAAASKRFNLGPDIALNMLPFVFLNPMLVVAGCIAIVFSYLLIIVTPLYLLETIFCYFIVVALLPLWVTAYAFPITRTFTVKAWDYLMAVFIQILGISIFLGLSAQIFSILMKKSFPSPAAFFAGLVTDPLGGVVSPAILIFVSYFIYLFGGVILDVLNAIFGLATPKGNVVKSMKNKATGALKSVKDAAQNGMDKQADANAEDMDKDLKEMKDNKKEGENGDGQGNNGEQNQGTQATGTQTDGSNAQATDGSNNTDAPSGGEAADSSSGTDTPSGGEES